MRRIIAILTGLSLLVQLGIFGQILGLLSDKDEKTVVYQMKGKQNHPVIVLIVDNPERYHAVSSPYEVIVIKRE